MDVVDDGQPRRRARRLPEDLGQPGHVVGHGDGDLPHAPGPGQVDELLHQAGLAHARFTDDRHDAAGAGLGTVEVDEQLGQFVAATDEPGGAPFAARRPRPRPG